MDEWLQDTVINGKPMDVGYDTVRWTRTRLAELLNQEVGVAVAGSTVSVHVKNLDLSYPPPTYRPSAQDPQEVEYFLNETFPRLQRLAEKLKADSGVEEEAGINLQTQAGKTWGRVGQPPEIRVTGQRGGYPTLSMVTAPGVMRFSVTDEKINSQKYIDFLKQLRQGRTRPLILIVDRVSFHSSKPVRDFVRSNRQKIRVFFLPRYSPELNPDEQLWNEIKSRKIGRKSIKTKLELKKKIYSALRSLQHNVEKIKSFFRLPDTKYALV